MEDLLPIIKHYSVKHDKKIKNICSPLVDYLGIPVFTYYFVEKDGRFGYITNALECNEYYFSQRLYLLNPYLSHPAHFRSGHALLPCTFDKEAQSVLQKRFRADHLFLSLQVNEAKMDGFIFANTDVGPEGCLPYMTCLDLLAKFGSYFKREAKDLIGKMKADLFNIREVRGKNLFDQSSSIPLANHDPKISAFLKKVTGLSRQEQRCLELFKLGKSAQATAALMGLSNRTVEYYFENIKNKLGCHSKYDLLND